MLARPRCAGGPLLTKFVGSFRELASFHELLRTQVELILVRAGEELDVLIIYSQKASGCMGADMGVRRGTGMFLWPRVGLAQRQPLPHASLAGCSQ